jgi:hypothetical protein
VLKTASHMIRRHGHMIAPRPTSPRGRHPHSGAD